MLRSLVSFCLAATILVLPHTSHAIPNSYVDVVHRQEQRYDQMRLLFCDQYQGHIIGYYERPPRPNEPPTQLAYRKRGTPSWEKGCNMHMKALTDVAEWGCEIPAWNRSESNFKSYLGKTTYGFTGFNCFQDDNHVAHTDANYGTCRTSIYCTHEPALSLALDASKETVDWIFRSTYREGQASTKPDLDGEGLVMKLLSLVEPSVRAQQCATSIIDLGNDLAATVDCNGVEPSHLQELLKALRAAFKQGKDS
jgi:hypothetical protein